jgi:hypothetical protein
MTVISNARLHELIEDARRLGATITFTLDADAREREGRSIIETVTVHSGAPGIGPFPMPAITAAETLRTFIGNITAERR